MEVQPSCWITAARRAEQHYPHLQLPLAALWPSKRMKKLESHSSKLNEPRGFLTFYLCLFLRLRGDRLWDALHIPLNLCEDLIQVLHLLIFNRIDLWTQTLQKSCHDNDFIQLKKKVQWSKNRAYMFQRCCDRLCLVLVLQVFVCDLKDAFSFLPLLFILPHFTWRQQQKHVNVNLLTSRDFILQLRPLVAVPFGSLNLFHHFDSLHAWTHSNTHCVCVCVPTFFYKENWDLAL